MNASHIRQTEQITWVSAEHLPDVDKTVQVTLIGDDEPVWIGFFDGTDWVDATTGGSFMGEVIACDVRGRVERVPTVAAAYVDIVFEPRWTPDRMSDVAKLATGVY